MNQIDDLIKMLGGNTKVAFAIGKGQTTVSEMKRRRSIPVRYWPALIDAGRLRGIEISEADLVRAHAIHAEQRASS